MKLLTEVEARISEAGSNANTDYGRAVVLYQHHVMTRQEFMRITNTISLVLINAIEGIKVAEDDKQEDENDN